MTTVYELDYNEYPDGIAQNIDLNQEVWDRGYCLETDDGMGLEIYVNDDVKNRWVNLEKDEIVTKFHGIHLGDYQEYNQVTFIELNGEEKCTSNELDEYLVKKNNSHCQRMRSIAF